jgi:hypothetical protein
MSTTICDTAMAVSCDNEQSKKLERVLLALFRKLHAFVTNDIEAGNRNRTLWINAVQVVPHS